jgi:hypothetical protein
MGETDWKKSVDHCAQAVDLPDFIVGVLALWQPQLELISILLPYAPGRFVSGFFAACRRSSMCQLQPLLQLRPPPTPQPMLQPQPVLQPRPP